MTARVDWVVLIVGLIGLALCAVAWFIEPRALYRAWLWAALFWNAIALGALVLIMLNQLTGGNWGLFIAPVLTASTRLILFVLLLLAPLVFVLPEIYLWISPENPDIAHTVHEKEAWLNVPFFLIRTLIVFFIWLVLAGALNLRRQSDARRSKISAIGLILYGIMVTVFVMDWIMSLDPHWHSTSLGFQTWISQTLTALSFATLVSALLIMHGRIKPNETEQARLQDLGNMMLGGVLLFFYLTFNHYLTLWFQNLPQKIEWYLHRLEHGWPVITFAFVALHGLALIALLSRRVKRTPTALMVVAGMILLGQALYLYWLVMPNFKEHMLKSDWISPAAFFGVSGIGVLLFLRLLRRRSEHSPQAHTVLRGGGRYG